ncbi:MAG: hypothetical protein WCJ14_00985 [Verrucomicrobiota bacterium]
MEHALPSRGDNVLRITDIQDDKSVVPGTKLYHAALQAAKVPCEFFCCATGGHGYGLRSKGDVAGWPQKCHEWLLKAGII